VSRSQPLRIRKPAYRSEPTGIGRTGGRRADIADGRALCPPQHLCSRCPTAAISACCPRTCCHARSGSACEMKLLCDVRKADWRAEITVLLYLAGVTPACPPRWGALPLLARPSPHLLARPPYRRDSAIFARSRPLCRRRRRVTLTGRGHSDRLKLACATARTTTLAGFGACQSGLVAEMNRGGRAGKLGIDGSSAAMWPPTVHSGTLRACAAKS
jgi:hypothetical protein